MITRIEAYRYRCFEKLAVDLGAYQVLVGRNGAGKSTLIDIPLLIGEILANRDLDKAFFESTASHRRPRADAPMELIHNLRGDYFAFALEARLPDVIRETIHRLRIEQAPKKLRAALEATPGRIYDSLRYELSLRIENDALEISQEHLFLLPADRTVLGAQQDGIWGEFVEEDELESLRIVIDRDHSGTARIKGENKSKSGKDEPFTTRLTGTTPALAGIPMDIQLFAASQWLMSFLVQDCVFYSPNLEKLRNAALPPGRNWRIASDASTLPWSILELKKAEKAFEEWLYHVKSVLPLLTDVSAKRREDDGLAYFYAQYGEDRKVNNSGLSDGTLAIFALTIPTFVKNAPPLMTIEEPENGIHPKAIEAVLETLAVVEGSQVLVTTHSPIAVAATPLEQLLCLTQTKTEGVIVTRGTDHDLLKNWKGTPSLATLHSAGVL
ncbi:MAG: AAA family ATPase [Opitutales bacterium]|nr:AAA family ATPase [Opitutales bacterium]